ncbi:myelin regulatory factor-like protein isoform X1 [Onthophagus taurus]|uniref:myelin regulatory factor-like protein isoform X1 n=2 Tax=Onthophagus taurus TaxID=166361 RepID=UPI000C2013F9|nr:myelin regulatory factor-like protein isoform X2 [Onthophagus taurus]
MDSASVDFTLQDVLERSSEFIGIDNEGLDFDQLEAFINSDASQNNPGNYFGETLPNPAGKILNVIVESKRNGHSLPESPPDSSSEHPYSPQETCEQISTPSDAIYSTLGHQQIYKPTLLNPILSNNLIIDSHIVVSDSNPEGLLENGALLQDINRAMLQSDENYVERNRNNDLLLVKNPDLVHIGGYNDLNCDPTPPNIVEGIQQTVYTNLQNAPKKRKLSQQQDVPLVKSEPEHCSQSPPSNLNGSIDDEFSASESCLNDSQYQCIRFTPFQQNVWHALCDQNLSELPVPHYRVDADKGFNFSNADDAFVCQKKNHFQITCHVQLLGDAQFVKTSKGFQKITSFHLHFYGVKHDCPTQTIRVEQSQSDRSKKPFHPVLVELVGTQVTKVTVGRLHFSETTSNNMRKKGKPNPEQRYFQLVVGLHAHTTHGDFPVISHASQKIIVRASNPGQFENDVELIWQKGQTQDSVFHAGKVGINTDRPDEALVVHGNLKITGHIIQPSDIRAKKNIVDCDTRQQLQNVQKLRVVRYEYDSEIASKLERSSGNMIDTGVIAQEVAEILPEAVSPAGNLILHDGTSIDNFLVVNKERIFMENIGAVKELCKVTDNLENRIDQLEKINRRLNKLKRGDSLKSNSTIGSGNTMKHVQHSKKCFKHHKCIEENELCSTKFIQVIIVVLILIMAFCLAAITTLYLIETGHKQLPQPNLHLKHYYSTNKPIQTTKNHQRWDLPFNIPTEIPYKDNGVEKAIEITPIDKEFSKIIGKPIDCANFDDLDPINSCTSFCCTTIIEKSIGSHLTFKEKSSKPTKNKTLTSQLEKTNKITKLPHKTRQKRDVDDINDKENTYDGTPDETNPLRITIQGKNFSTDITRDYLLEEDGLGMSNFTYDVPISKYMPDSYVRVVFRAHQRNVVVEQCHSTRLRPCSSPMMSPNENKTQNGGYTVDENVPVQMINDHVFVFEVDMTDSQAKIMTYRHTQRQNQNICKISPSKLGLEFTEYNFKFYRPCDE